MKIRPIEDYTIGDKAEIQHTITIEDIYKFAELSGDYNPLHMDIDFVARTAYKKPVAHGMLSAAFISALIGQKLPGPGALWFEQSMKFILPIYVKDTITITATVSHISIAQQVLVLQIEIANQHHKLVLSGEAKVKVINQEVNHANASNDKSAVIISGGASGIGAAIAQALAIAGHPVVINYHQRRDEAETLMANINQQAGKAIAIKADITNSKQVENMLVETLSHFESVEGYIHCAAAPILPKSILEMGWDDMQTQLDVQLKGAFNLAQVLLPQLIKQQYGNIIHIVSTVVDNIPPDKWAAYVAAKSALLSFTRSLATEYGPQGIRVNAVSPGMTLTEMTADVSDRTRMIVKQQTPLRRLANTIDIAETVKFLMNAEARHITGQNIRVCGGAIMA